MIPWSLRCSKLAFGKTNKISVFVANTYSGCPWSGKKSERNHFFQSQARNCQGFLTSVRQFFNLSQNQEILKNRFINCQTTMNTNILQPVACPYEHKTEVTRISKLDVEIQSIDSICRS